MAMEILGVLSIVGGCTSAFLYFKQEAWIGVAYSLVATAFTAPMLFAFASAFNALGAIMDRQE